MSAAEITPVVFKTLDDIAKKYELIFNESYDATVVLKIFNDRLIYDGNVLNLFGVYHNNITEDIPKAIEFYELATKHEIKNYDAAYNLANIYSDDKTSYYNKQQAFSYYSIAAESGVHRFMYKFAAFSQMCNNHCTAIVWYLWERSHRLKACCFTRCIMHY